MVGGIQDLVADLLAPIGGVSFRRMFGGVGLFRDSVMFALIIEDTLFMKADETTRGRFEAEGCEPFSYGSKRGTVVTSYWQVPERLYDDGDTFCDWAREAMAVADRARETKAGGRKRSRGKPS
jgi:DNA transformation protein